MHHLRWPLLLLLLLAAPAAACLWDRDTLKFEAKGLPGLPEILTGRIERFPPLYYEMRLERVTNELAADPSNLALYDDAAVAADRLHRSSDAIEWMRRKAEHIPEADTQHRYRYHANLGTFLAHRWLRAGASRADLDDLKRARDHIAQAIEINPDAHFGRESYQLMAIDWLLAGDVTRGDWAIPSFSGLMPETRDRLASYDKDTAEDAVAGLSGLIVLGDAWQSLDVYYALEQALYTQGHASLAMLAGLRCVELVEAGARPLRSDAITADTSAIIDELLFPQDIVSNADQVRAYYKTARRKAQAWHAAREQFILARLREGKHPDTHPAFWSGYRETNAPALPGYPVPGDTLLEARIWAIPALIAALLLVAARRMRRALGRRSARIRLESPET